LWDTSDGFEEGRFLQEYSRRRDADGLHTTSQDIEGVQVRTLNTTDDEKFVYDKGRREGGWDGGPIAGGLTVYS
jgi:hypothetical protein